jgi:preprotein translocase subunit SecD
MGTVRLLRIVTPLALVAALATACGSGSSSSSQGSGGPSSPSTSVGASSSLELRPVYARYATGISLGPAVPQALVDTMSHQRCPTKPRVVQGMLLECDAGKTVYLLKAPIVSGGVASATAQQIGHKNLWFVKISLDPATAATLGTAAKTLVGSELAFSFGGAVVSSEIIESSFDTGKLAIIGSYTKAQATKLASRIAAS